MSLAASKCPPTFTAVWASEPIVIISPPSSLYLFTISGQGLTCDRPLLSGEVFISMPCPVCIISFKYILYVEKN